MENKITLPIGMSNFTEIRKNHYYYIDKTGLIKNLLQNNLSKGTLITRPRRFGKTLAMCMLADFFDIRKDSRALFDGLYIVYDAFNHPDEGYLKSIYPADIIKNMSDWIRHHLSSEESQEACDRYADAILADSFLLSKFMENYDISQNGLASYRNEIDRMKK